MGFVRRGLVSGSVVVLAAMLSGGASAAVTAQPVTKAALKPYVLRVGDEPGYRPDGGSSFSGSTNFVGIPAAIRKRYRAEGYRGNLFEGFYNGAPVGGDEQSISSVVVLGSPAAAKSEIKAAFSSAPRPFTIKQIPTSLGVMGSQGKQKAAEIAWIEGSCFVYIRNFNTGKASVVDSAYDPRATAIAGALAIYNRTAR